jgi:hypothetical protein
MAHPLLILRLEPWSTFIAALWEFLSIRSNNGDKEKNSLSDIVADE